MRLRYKGFASLKLVGCWGLESKQNMEDEVVQDKKLLLIVADVSEEKQLQQLVAAVEDQSKTHGPMLQQVIMQINGPVDAKSEWIKTLTCLHNYPQSEEDLKPTYIHIEGQPSRIKPRVRPQISYNTVTSINSENPNESTTSEQFASMLKRVGKYCNPLNVESWSVGFIELNGDKLIEASSYTVPLLVAFQNYVGCIPSNIIRVE